MKQDMGCYFCDQPATTNEHVPPRNLFPDAEKYTYNLLSVPSCYRHNNNKSDLDSRMRLFLVGVNKKIHHDKDFKKIIQKVVRASMRDIKLFNNFAKDTKLVRKKNKELTFLNENFADSEVNIVYADHKFYQECILKGIYKKTFGDSWKQNIFIIPMSLIGFDENFDDFYFATGIQCFEYFTEKNLNKHSKNKVFQYSVEQITGLTIVSVCLYMKYYFHGIFGEDALLENLKNKFTPDNPVITFNNSIYIFKDSASVASS